MILALIGTAGLYGMLGSYFLAALQVLVYAGAIMVVVVFVIMLIEVKDEEQKKLGVMNLIAAGIAAALMIAGVVGLSLSPELVQTFPSLPENSESALVFSGNAQNYGIGLFGKYLLPIQVMGFLLLLAMVGVILISKDLGKRMGLGNESESIQTTDSDR